MEENPSVNETPEVDIDRLMDEIREEVAERRQKGNGISGSEKAMDDRH